MESNSEESNNRPVLERSKTEKAFISPTILTAYALVEAGAIISKPNVIPYYQQYEIDLGKAVQILKELDQKHSRPGVLTNEEKQQLELKAQGSYKKVVKAFVQSGAVSKDLAVQVGYILRPTGVEILDTDYHRFLYLSDHFPSSTEQRASLQLGTDRYQQHIDELSNFLSAEGIVLGAGVIEEIARRWGIAHEYGHAVERTIELTQLMANTLANPQEEVWKLAFRTADRINNDIYQLIAPSEPLKEILDDEPSTGFYALPKNTSSERIAAGFEILGLKYALEESGIQTDQVAKIIGRVLADYQKRFQECVQFKQMVKSKGMNLEIVSEALTHLSVQMKEAGFLDLRGRVSVNIGARFLGYFHPLNEDELRNYIDSYYRPDMLLPLKRVRL